MRKSGIGFLNLSSLSVDQEAVRELDGKHDAFSSASQSLTLAIRHQLELLDDLEITGSKATNNSFLHKIVSEIVAFNSCYVQSQSRYFDKAIEETVKKGEVDCRDNMLFSRRGGRKTNIDDRSIRRMSFAATNYRDNTEILRVEKLKEMADLEFLFSLNGYHLPYANSTARRSMYEFFFSIFIGEIVSLHSAETESSGALVEAVDFYLFSLLQESIYMLHTVTEYTVSIAECIFEMMNWVNPRLKSVPMSVNLKLPVYTGTSSPLLDHLTGCFTDENKIFSAFMKKRLTTAINELRKEEIRDWKGRLENYHHSLSDGLELYEGGCDRFIDSIRLYRKRWTSRATANEQQPRPDIEMYLTDVEMYIDQTRKFILLLAEEQSVYRRFYQTAIDLLDTLNGLQEKYPVRYGGSITPRSPRPSGSTPRTPKTPIIEKSRSQSNSRTGSPRTGSDVDSPRQTPEPGGERSKSAGTSGLLSRVASIFASSK